MVYFCCLNALLMIDFLNLVLFETGNLPSMFSLKINHGVFFTYYPGPKRTRSPRRVYKGGNADWFDEVDADVFSIIEVKYMLKELGYVSPGINCHYKNPTSDLDKGCAPLKEDSDVLDMIKYVSKFKLIELCVEHPVDKSVVLDDDHVGLGPEKIDLENVNVGLEN